MHGPKSHTNTHLEVQVAQPVVEIRGDKGFNFFKLVELCVWRSSDEWGFEPGRQTQSYWHSAYTGCISFFFLKFEAHYHKFVKMEYSVKSNSCVALICHWPTCRGWDRGLVHTLEMPPKPALSWHGCWVLVDLLAGMSGSWREGARRLLVGSGDTWETPHSPTMQVKTHACRRTNTQTLRHTHQRMHTYADARTQHRLSRNHKPSDKQTRWG